MRLFGNQTVIASEAWQSLLLDCFVALLLAMTAGISSHYREKWNWL
jgi:hypothetical protein